jgi:hypothetical protein
MRGWKKSRESPPSLVSRSHDGESENVTLSRCGPDSFRMKNTEPGKLNHGALAWTRARNAERCFSSISYCNAQILTIASLPPLAR